MRCLTLCSIGIAFLVANLVVTITSDKGKQKAAFYKTLTPELVTKYESLIEERRCIYLTGYVYGLILAFGLVVYAKKTKKIGSSGGVCVMAGVTLLTNYFYYILSPKSDSMIVHLDKEEQRVEWQKIYRSMQVKYHSGLLLGVVAAAFFGASTCAKI
tara:strand:+ start:123 stop:593 length:471 start_codon:yes stop_codon:yes gene_type:complete